MANYSFRYVITKSGRVFRLDGWTPVREIIGGYWKQPNFIEQEEILSGLILDENAAESLASEEDSDVYKKSYPTHRLINTLIYSLAVLLYSYFEGTLKQDFNPSQLTKHYIFKSCFAYSIYVIDIYLQSGLSYYDYKDNHITDFLTYGTPKYYNYFFEAHENEEEVSDYIWDLYSTYAVVGDSEVPSDYNLRDIILDKRIIDEIEKNSDPIKKGFNYLHRTILNFINEDYSYPKLGIERNDDLFSASTIISYNNIYFSSLQLVKLIKDVLEQIEAKIKIERE